MAKATKVKNPTPTPAKKDGDAFVVLTKGNRTLVVQQPTKKQMKRYDKKSWVKTGCIGNGTAEKFRETLGSLVKHAGGDSGTS